MQILTIIVQVLGAISASYKIYIETIVPYLKKRKAKKRKLKK